MSQEAISRKGASASAEACNAAEGELIERAKHDPQAFGLLYEAHYARILNYVYRRTLDVSVAEELTSNTFFNALRALPKYRHRVPFRAWLYRIATNEVRMRWRRLKRRPALEAQLERIHFSDAAEPPDVVREKLQSYARLHECLARLPEKYQAVIALRYLEELPIAEVAQVMDKREGTVKSLIHRGLKRLRALMGDDGATFL